MAYNVVYQSQGAPAWYEEMMKLLASRAQAGFTRREQEEALGNYRYPELRQAEISPYTREILLQQQRRTNELLNRPQSFQLGTRYGTKELDRLNDLAEGFAEVNYDISTSNKPFPGPEEFKRYFKQRTGIDFPSDMNVPTSTKELNELNRRTFQIISNDPIWQSTMQRRRDSSSSMSLPSYEDTIRKKILNIDAPFTSREMQGVPLQEYQEGVENALREQSIRNYEEFVRPQLAEQFTRAGQFGSRRHGDLAQKALASQTRDLDQRIAHLKYNNYLDRLNAAKENRRLGLQAAMGAQQHASHLQNIEHQNRQEMLGLGEMERAMQQQQKDIEYQDWLRQKQAPEQNLATFSSQVAGISPGTSYMQSVQQTPPPQQMNLAGNIGSIAGQLLTARRAGAFNKGGLVRRYY